jgi:hypothetical protein
MIYIILIIVLIVSLFSSKTENILPGRCYSKFRSGIRFNNMEVCKRKCPKFIPEHLRKKNYCEGDNGVVACFPPDWIFN